MKYIKILCVAALIISLCAGCKSPSEESTAHEVSVIKIIKPGHIPEFSNIINAFNEENTDVQVKFVDAPSSTEERHRLYVSALSGRDASVDIYWINDEWTEEFVNEGYIMPLSDDIEPDKGKYIVKADEMFSENGSLYALPIGLDMEFIFYRRDLMETPQSSWSKIMEQCRTAANNGVLMPMCVEKNDMQDIIYNIVRIKRSNGFSYAQSLEIYNELMSGYEPEGDMPVDSFSIFRTGKAMMLLGRGSLWNKLNNNTSAVKGNVGVSYLPGTDKGSVGSVFAYGLAVNANSKNPEAAMRFLNFVNSEENQQRISRDCSVMPVIEALYDDEMILDANPYIRGIKETVKNAPTYKSLGISGETLKRAEEALIKYFGNEETANSTGETLEALLG